MTVERMFELITDGLVFICFSCLGFVSVLVFPACLLVVPVHVRKRGDPLKPATTAQFFFDRLRPCCKKSLGRVRICGVEQQGVAYAKTVAEAMNLKLDADNPADREKLRRAVLDLVAGGKMPKGKRPS